MIISGTRLVGGKYAAVPPPTFTPVLSLDAGNPASYPGSGSTWTDTVNSRTFTLYNNPTYSSSNGGYLNFAPSNSQWAYCSSSLPTMSNWTVEAWHYYDGTNAGTDVGGVGACLVTETFPGSTFQINYSLGNDQGGLISGATDLQAGFFNGAWRTTVSGYTLTAGNWYQIVGTYDGTTIKLYVNNSIVSSVNYTGSVVSSNDGIRLMSRWDNADFWGGKLSIVRIYDVDIGSVGVNQNWTTSRSRFGL